MSGFRRLWRLSIQISEPPEWHRVIDADRRTTYTGEGRRTGYPEGDLIVAQTNEMRTTTKSGAPDPASRRARAYGLTWMLLPVVVFAAFFVTVARMVNAEPTARPPSSLDASSAAISVALAKVPDIQATTGFVFDGDTGEIYYTKDADVERPMASTTKVMTALLAIEAGGLDRAVTIGADAEALAVPGSSRMGVSAGEKIRLRDLLYGLLLPSGNDAAVAIADEVGGSEAAFVDLMNARARELGLTHTHYMNPHGLNDDPNHYTSARDLATLEAAALKLAELRQDRLDAALQYSGDADTQGV